MINIIIKKIVKHFGTNGFAVTELSKSETQKIYQKLQAVGNQILYDIDVTPFKHLDNATQFVKNHFPTRILNLLPLAEKNYSSILIKGLPITIDTSPEILKWLSLGINSVSKFKPTAYASRQSPFRVVSPQKGLETMSGSAGGGELLPHTDWPQQPIQTMASRLSLLCKIGHPDVATGYAALSDIIPTLSRKAINELQKPNFLIIGSGSTQTLQNLPNLDLYKPILINTNSYNWFTQLESLDNEPHTTSANDALRFLEDKIYKSKTETVLEAGDFFSFSNNRGYHWRPNIPANTPTTRELMRQSSMPFYYDNRPHAYNNSLFIINDL